MPATKQPTSEHVLRGRSPWPIASSRGRSEASSPSEQTAAQTRSSKRKKRSDLSPSSKATHSIIERERREAMNEKFSELAAQVPELVEAIASGKRPTKGEIVKASIARHQAQDRLIQEMQLELQALRASNDLQGITTQQGLAASMPAITVDLSQAYALPYQIQPSRPIMQSTEEGSVWLGHLLGKTSDHADQSPTFQPTLVSGDSVTNVSPFKQSSLMSGWSYPGSQLESYSFDLGPAMLEKAMALVNTGMLDQLSRSDSLSTFPSPTFTSSDTDSSFSSDPLDPAHDDPAFLADTLTEHMAFEPFVLTDDTVEETPLSALLNLPSSDPVEQSKPRNRSRSRPSISVKEERMTPDAPTTSSTLLATT